MNGTRRKLFISYYNVDETYRKRFEDLFGHLFINKSVKPGDIDEDLSTNYVKRLIQKGYLNDTSVLVVLVGPKTYCRKYVDWEISAGLDSRVGGRTGLIGLCLPNHPDYKKDKYTSDIVPPRLVDNIKTGYAKFYDWTESETLIKNRVEEAFKAKTSKSHLINNSSAQYKNNRCS